MRPVVCAPRRLCAPSFVLLKISLLASLLLCAPHVRAGTYVWQTTDPSTGAVTAQSPTFSGGQWYSGYRNPSGPFPYEGGSTGDSSGQTSSSGDVTATFTWSDQNNPADPAPPCIVTQTCTAAWYAGGFFFFPTASCSDGLGDPEVDTASGESYSGSSVGTQYSAQSPSSGVIKVTLKGAQAQIDPGSNRYGSYSSTVSWSVSVSPVTISPGGAIQDSSGGYNILVGQGCGVGLSGIPSTLRNNTANPPTYQWSVSGATFQDWSVVSDPNNQSHTTEVDGPGPLTNSTAHWFWNDAQQTPETVTCTATVTPPAGQGSQFSVTATQKVTVYVPSWTATNATGYGYVGYPNSSQSLELYAGPSAAMQQKNQTDGSVWVATVSSPLAAFTGAGQWGYAQIINPGENFVLTDGSRAASTDSGVPALDNTFPYEGTHTLDGGQQKDGDAPALPLNDAFAEVFMTDVFKTYLMFRPSGSDTRWVPLAETGWDTEFDAKEPGSGHWTDYPANTSAGPVLPIFDFKPQNVYPSWNKVLPKGTALFH